MRQSKAECPDGMSRSYKCSGCGKRRTDITPRALGSVRIMTCQHCGQKPHTCAAPQTTRTLEENPWVKRARSSKRGGGHE